MPRSTDKRASDQPNLPSNAVDAFEVPLDEDGKIIDFLSETQLEPNPEEFVRQRYLRTLHYEYQYPKNVLAREVSIYYGRKVIVDKHGKPVRADIMVYSNAKACSEQDQGKIELIVE